MLPRKTLAPLPLMLALSFFPSAAGAVETALQLVLELPGNAERNVVRYECDGAEPFAVEYLNAAPTFLAILPIEGEQQLFANVVSASGARYVSGRHEWWTSGSEATLTDVTAPEGTAPLACFEIVDTP
jgi:membrane-bound inhibitor of C-type lysozyme